MPDAVDFDPSHHVLIIKCPDTRGIVAAVSGYLYDNDISIVESNQFNDSLGDMFYVRMVFKQAGPKMPPMPTLRDGFKPIAHRFSMDWEIFNLTIKPKVLIAVSKFGHCLYELLHRWRSGLLPVDIACVMSNHEDMRSFVEWNAGNRCNLKVPAEREQFVLRRLVENVVNDLNSIDSASAKSL